MRCSPTDPSWSRRSMSAACGLSRLPTSTWRSNSPPRGRRPATGRSRCGRSRDRESTAEQCKTHSRCRKPVANLGRCPAHVRLHRLDRSPLWSALVVSSPAPFHLWRDRDLAGGPPVPDANYGCDCDGDDPKRKESGGETGQVLSSRAISNVRSWIEAHPIATETALTRESCHSDVAVRCRDVVPLVDHDARSDENRPGGKQRYPFDPLHGADSTVM